MQYISVQFSSVQLGFVQFNAVRISSVQFKLIPFGSIKALIDNTNSFKTVFSTFSCAKCIVGNSQTCMYGDRGGVSTDDVSEALYSDVVRASVPQAADSDLLRVWTHV